MQQFERLSRLSDYTVDAHQIDPRGWDLVNTDGRIIGEVKDLIVDTATMKGTYLDVELDSKLFDLRRDPRVLIPVDRAQRHGDRKRLQVAGLDSARVQELCADRERHYYEFWDGFWRRQLSADDLRRAVENVKPGEQLRVPVVNEEIVVERRPLHPDEHAVAHAADERPASPPRTLDL